MDKLKSFALMLLFVSAALAAVTFLLPSGRISKSAKAVFSVFMTLCVVAPLFALLDIFSGFEAPDITENGSGFAAAAEEKIKDALGAEIDRRTDIPYNISLNTDIGGDFVINIESVRISFSERPENLDEIAFALEKELGFMPEFKLP